MLLATLSEWNNITRLARKKQLFKLYLLGTNSIPVYDIKGCSAIALKNPNKYLKPVTNKVENVSWINAHIIMFGNNQTTSEISLVSNYGGDIVVVDTSKTPHGKVTRSATTAKVNFKIQCNDESDTLTIKKSKRTNS